MTQVTREQQGQQEMRDQLVPLERLGQRVIQVTLVPLGLPDREARLLLRRRRWVQEPLGCCGTRARAHPPRVRVPDGPRSVRPGLGPLALVLQLGHFLLQVTLLEVVLAAEGRHLLRVLLLHYLCSELLAHRFFGGG